MYIYISLRADAPRGKVGDTKVVSVVVTGFDVVVAVAVAVAVAAVVVVVVVVVAAAAACLLPVACCLLLVACVARQNRAKFPGAALARTKDFARNCLREILS